MRTLDKVKYTKGNKDLQSVNSEQDIELKVTNGELQFSTDGTNFANVSADMLTGASNPTSSTNGKEGQLYRNTLTDDIFILGWKVFGVPVWILLGGDGKQNTTKTGAGAPTTSTSGAVGQFYYDTTNNKWYYLSSISGATYTWTMIGTIPSGGTQGQVLTKNSSTDYDAVWANASGGDAVTLDTTTQEFEGNKTLMVKNDRTFSLINSTYGSRKFSFNPSNPYISVEANSNFYVKLKCDSIIRRDYGSEFVIYLPTTAGYLALKSDITAKVPDAPTTDGTYTLKVVVSNGKPTYQWVLDN